MGNCLRNSFRFVCVFVRINSQTANYHLPNSIAFYNSLSYQFVLQNSLTVIFVFPVMSMYAIYIVKEKLCLFVREISFTVYFLF